MKLNIEEIKRLREVGLTFQEIADKAGVSRQRVHARLNTPFTKLSAGRPQLPPPTKTSTRKCWSCGETKPLTGYYKNSRDPWGKSHRCIKCTRGQQNLNKYNQFAT